MGVTCVKAPGIGIGKGKRGKVPKVGGKIQIPTYF